MPASAVAAGLPLTSLGLDSLAAVELKAELESAFGVAIPLAELAEGASLEALTERVLGRRRRRRRRAAALRSRPSLRPNGGSPSR